MAILRLFGGFRDSFLLTLIESLNLDGPILVSPSMSGGYSLPLLVKRPDKLRGFVAVAPVNLPQFMEQLTGVTVPTLAIWGSNDPIVRVNQADELIKRMPNAKKVILTNAGHACYMLATKDFQEQLLVFIESVLKT